MAIQYTDEQMVVVNSILSDIKNKKKQITMGGYAGTGKTTIIKQLIESLNGFAVCAYTGKAANILRKKGMSAAQTIHSTIYDVVQNKNSISYIIKPKYMLGFNGFIVDEASMVGEEIYKDIMYFDKPVLYVGDHGQLPPIGSNKFNLMNNPEYKLEHIHRNAGNIANFAQHLRLGNKSKDYDSSSDDVIIYDKRYVDIKSLTKVDQVICAYNKTRIMLNNEIRKYLKLAKEPVVGDKIIILKNNKNLNIFNGQQGVISRINSKTVDIQFDSRVARELKYNPDLFGQEKIDQDTLNDMKDIAVMDFSYAVTCHKAQGDQFESIAVLEEPCSMWEMNRWNYTAASRAEKTILWYT